MKTKFKFLKLFSIQLHAMPTSNIHNTSPLQKEQYESTNPSDSQEFQTNPEIEKKVDQLAYPEEQNYFQPLLNQQLIKLNQQWQLINSRKKQTYYSINRIIFSILFLIISAKPEDISENQKAKLSKLNIEYLDDKILKSYIHNTIGILKEELTILLDLIPMQTEPILLVDLDINEKPSTRTTQFNEQNIIENCFIAHCMQKIKKYNEHKMREKKRIVQYLHKILRMLQEKPISYKILSPGTLTFYMTVCHIPTPLFIPPVNSVFLPTPLPTLLLNHEEEKENIPTARPRHKTKPVSAYKKLLLTPKKKIRL